MIFPRAGPSTENSESQVPERRVAVVCEVRVAGMRELVPVPRDYRFSSVIADFGSQVNPACLNLSAHHDAPLGSHVTTGFWAGITPGHCSAG